MIMQQIYFEILSRAFSRKRNQNVGLVTCSKYLVLDYKIGDRSRGCKGSNPTIAGNCHRCKIKLVLQ